MSKTSNQEERVKRGIRMGIFGLFSNLLLVFIKLTAGITAGSVSILADAMNSIVDSISSILTIGGFFIASKPADKEHPYGHQRAEYISGLFVAIMILLVGLEFLSSSIRKILNPVSIVSSKLVLFLLIFSIFLKIALGYYYKYLNKNMNISSNIIAALIKDSFNDAMMTSVIVISYFIEIQFNWYIDGYVGAAVAIYILYSGIRSIIETSNDLLGSRPDPELVQEMKKLLDSYDSIHGYHDLIIHNYGPNKIFVTVDIEIDSRWSLIEAHRVLDQIERDFEKQFNIKTVSHLDPIVFNDPKQTEIFNLVKAILESLDENFKFHDFQIIQPNKKKEIHFDVVVPSNIQVSDKELYHTIEKKIHKQFPHYKLVIEFDRYYILHEE